MKEQLHDTLERFIEIVLAAGLAFGSGASAISGEAVEIREREPTSTPRSDVTPAPRQEPKPTGQNHDSSTAWRYDPEVSFYGPGFYGNRTACGQRYTTVLLGVAHRTYPCGTLIEFRYKGRRATVPVIDRGPYIRGRTWDLSGGLCTYLRHCFTGPIEWRFVK